MHGLDQGKAAKHADRDVKQADRRATKRAEWDAKHTDRQAKCAAAGLGGGQARVKT